ncbi:MAG: hypothetical protein U0350_50835 [Caldilineaceae bacterium]
MRLPNYENAIVAESKIVDYLLSQTNEDGKAGFFARFGFAVAEWVVLANMLLAHAAEYEVIRTVTTPHGTKYIVAGRLSTPDGRNPNVRTVWLIEHDQVIARLITAYPVKG